MDSFVITAEEVRLVREAGRALIDSYVYKDYSREPPRPLHAKDQPPEWHEGRKLVALAQRLGRMRGRKCHVLAARP